MCMSRTGPGSTLLDTGMFNSHLMRLENIVMLNSRDPSEMEKRTGVSAQIQESIPNSSSHNEPTSAFKGATISAPYCAFRRCSNPLPGKGTVNMRSPPPIRTPSCFALPVSSSIHSKVKLPLAPFNFTVPGRVAFAARF